jgi:hypothetical protein
VVATISNGEALPIIHNRIVDAGFSELDIIHMGADKVLIRSTSAIDVTNVIDGAKEFFDLFFSNRVRWKKETALGYAQRGAWVRLYGIPLHAWNEIFFKLCVMDCGRYLRADSYTVEKVRLDYARILIATPALEVVNRVEKLLVEGELVEIKIVEEWGMALGEDACLYDNEPESETYHSDNEAAHCDPEASNNVDMLVDKIVKEAAADMEVREHTIPQERVMVKGQTKF